MSLSKIQLSELLQVYGALLTDIQRDAITMYCDCDCTLSEIAAERGISRQAVRDAIVKGEASLTKFETELGLANFEREIRRALVGCDSDKIESVVKSFISRRE